jgi:taurine dioxygenase
MPLFRFIQAEPLSGACGCEIRGVDLTSELSKPVLADILAALEHFLVIVFRDQPLTLEQHKRISRYLGELIELPQAPVFDDDPHVQEVRLEADEPFSLVPSFEDFHIDSPFLKEPPAYAVMRALHLPRYGGDTVFSNSFLAYESLSAGLKDVLGGLRIVYSGKDIWAKNAKREESRRLRLRENQDAAQLSLENVHPAVRVQPRTGRKALFVTKAYFKRFVGWTEEESRVLGHFLHSQAQRPQYQCRVRWRPNTLIVWDNRFLQHRGVNDFQHERRHLVRTTLIERHA